jgi:hypothetical protein
LSKKEKKPVHIVDNQTWQFLNNKPRQNWQKNRRFLEGQIATNLLGKQSSQDMELALEIKKKL